MSELHDDLCRSGQLSPSSVQHLGSLGHLPLMMGAGEQGGTGRGEGEEGAGRKTLMIMSDKRPGGAILAVT